MARPPQPDEQPPSDATAPEPAWRQRAIDRSTEAARRRAAQRVQRFLNAAREIIADKGSTEFTVQEVVDRSKQSLRSFYQYFDGKHELLLALFEEEMEQAVVRLREATADGAPLDRLERAVRIQFELCSPGRVSVQPLFAEFAERLMVDHPEEVAAAFAPVVDVFTEIADDLAAAGQLRSGKPRRLAATMLQSVTFTAQRNGGGPHPLTADEVWDFCRHAAIPDSVTLGEPG